MLARRWWWVGLLAAVSGCSAVAPTPSASPKSVPLPTPTVITTLPPSPAPTATPTPKPQPLLAAIGPACTARNLTMRTGVSGAGAGTAAVVLVFTDVGSARCSLRGAPEARFFDDAGQVVKVNVSDQLGGFFPSVPNAGVGLLPMVHSGQTGTAGIRGQAGLAVSWSDLMCGLAAPITRIEVMLPTGGFSVPIQIFGFGSTGCLKPVIVVTPFEAAELAGA